MSEAAKDYRAKMKEKARRLAGQKNDGVTASTWKPDEPLDADVKTGMRPLSKRQFNCGGKVGGTDVAHHAGRAARKNGGKIGVEIVNRDVKEANEERDGKKHVGGMKGGGRAKKLYGGGLYNMQNTHSGGPGSMIGGTAGDGGGGDGTGKKKLPGTSAGIDTENKLAGSFASHGRMNKGGRAKKADGGELAAPAAGPVDPIDAKIEKLKAQIAMLEQAKAAEGGGDDADAAAPPPDDQDQQPPMKRGGRAKRADGGPVKGRTNINIIIAPQGKAEDKAPPTGVVPPPDAGAPPPADMGAAPPPAMPVPPDGGGGGAPGVQPGIMPPGLGQMLAQARPHKDGGRVIHMQHGAGGGLGRLEKVQKYGAKH